MPPQRPKLNDATCRLVLVVDDNYEVREVIARILGREGIPCVTAESAARAIQIMQTREVAVILTDVRMPEIDGLELLRVVRRDYPLTRRLVLTGRETAEIAREATALAHRSPLLKPGDPYDITQNVLGQLEVYRLDALEVLKANGSNGHA